VIAEPPVLEGALHDNPTCAFPGVADRDAGALGMVGTVTEFDAVDDALVPATFVAVIVKVYAAPAVSPVTVIGLPVEVALNVFVLSIAV